jgi:hypothetical protein
MNMNTIRRIFFIAAAMFWLTGLQAQTDKPGDEIARHIRNGNARELSQHFNTTIQLTVPGDDGRYSRTQAEMIVRNFFSKNPPRTFAINHQGSSSDGSQYFVGTYTSGNKSYHSYYLIKEVSGKMLIHQLRFLDED